MPIESQLPYTVNKGPSPTLWESMKTRIHRIYIEDCRPLKDVMDIMSSQHNFKATPKMYNSYFRKWGPEFDKNKKKGRSPRLTPFRQSSGKRTRPRRLVDHKPRQATIEHHTPVILYVVPFALDRYRKIEVVLYSASNYIYGLFDIFNWDEFVFIPPEGVQDLLPAWQYISDQCFGSTSLLLRGDVTEGMRTLGHVCDMLREVFQFCNPAMMVKLWRVCHRFHKTCCKSGDFKLFTTVLRYIRGLANLYHGRNHPLFQMLDAIIQVPQGEQLGMLKVAYLRTIHVMELRLGQQHAIVLGMWSNYLKIWKSESPNGFFLVQRYRSLLHVAELQFGLTGENTIAVLHNFMYAGYYNFHDHALTAGLALDLYNRVKLMACLQPTPRWCLPTQGFTFAAKLLAIFSVEAGKTQDCQQYMEEAISILERGDRECLTRAIMLTSMLHDWLEEWGVG